METEPLEQISIEEKLIQANLENSILLSISEEVSSAKNKQDLFPIINNTLKQLFSYDDGVICTVNDDQQTYSAFLYNPEEVFAKYPGCESLAEMKFPVYDGIYNVIVEADQVIVLELDEVTKLSNASVYIPFWIQQGMKQLIGVPLKTGAKTIGSFSFYTKERDTIPAEKFKLLYGICSQIAIAIQNVLTNELIEINSFEKNVLLDTCNELALSKERAGLASVLNRKLRKVLPFYCGVLGLVDNYPDKFLNFDLESPGKNNLGFTATVPFREMPLNNEIQLMLLRNTFPVVAIIQDKGVQSPLIHFLKDINTSVWNEAVVVCLFEEKKLIGFLALYAKAKHAFRNSHLEFLKGIASQLSSVASNILTKEDLKKKEREKSFLLSFSNHIATVRDINGLKFIIKQSLKQLPTIRAYIITIKNEDNRTYRHFLHDLPVDDPNDEGFKIITGTNMSKKGTLTEAVLRSDTPVIFEVKEIVKSQKYFFPARSFWAAAGAEKILGIRLKVADEDMGILWLEPAAIHDRLLKGIAAQIAIALANAMANDSLARQFDEIRQYKQRLEEENLYLQKEIEINYNHSEIIGSGAEMKKIFHLLSQVAYTNSTVLILGETGTGKELLARAIHNASPRRDKLMVKVNCAAFPINLIESELFGHERGSFTGAFEQKIGKFELANNGTLFLDEIGEMPPDLQVKILRALQEREIERVGGKKTIKINVRIIAATNRDLQLEVKEGRFRSDLFYRLNVFPVTMPPLRKRIEDIPLLVNHFIKKHARNTGKQVAGISQKALSDLTAYSWPGNIRELEHMIERSLLLSTGNTIKQVYLPGVENAINISHGPDTVLKTIDENERDHIIAVLKKCFGKIFGAGGAAEILGIPPSTLNSKMKKLKIKKDQLVKN